jgi:uncharacterized protein (TIGR04222 family)
MLNPFALHGFAFLVFYLIVGLLGLAGQYIWSRSRELSGLVPQLNMTDPYQIAYLRGGAEQALNIAAVSLIDRGLLQGVDATLKAERNAAGLVRRPIEKAILDLYLTGSSAADMRLSPSCIAACEEYRQTLEDFELVAGTKVFHQRLIPLLLFVGILGFIGILKITMAVAEGRGFGILFALMAFLGAVAIKIYRRHRTARGDAMLADLEVLFSRLRDRADTLRQGGATNEAALLAAIYGVDKLPADRFPGTKPLRRKKQDSSCGGGSGCGSSCGGSCGGGCGGGCGG